MKIRSGFTLIELLISLGITAVLITILASLFGSIVSQRQTSEAVSGLAQDSRFLLLRLSHDVARASSIISPTEGASDTSLTLVIDGVNYVYGQIGDQLTLSVGGATAESLTSNLTRVTNLSFLRHNDLGTESSITIDITLAAVSAQVGTQNKERRFTTTLVTR